MLTPLLVCVSLLLVAVLLMRLCDVGDCDHGGAVSVEVVARSAARVALVAARACAGWNLAVVMQSVSARLSTGMDGGRQ